MTELRASLVPKMCTLVCIYGSLTETGDYNLIIIIYFLYIFSYIFKVPSSTKF